MVTDSTTAIASRTRCIAVVSLALAVTVLLGGCSSGGDSAKSAKTTTSTVASQSSTTATQAPATNAPATGGSQTTSAPATTSPPSGPAPVITTFVTPDNIDCHNGNSQTFSASWTTTNAVKVTISIDGPGVYKTYAANGSDSLPFNCSSSHSFLLTAYGQDGRTATKTITLQPRNVQTSTPTAT